MKVTKVEKELVRSFRKLQEAQGYNVKTDFMAYALFLSTAKGEDKGRYVTVEQDAGHVVAFETAKAVPAHSLLEAMGEDMEFVRRHLAKGEAIARKEIERMAAESGGTVHEVTGTPEEMDAQEERIVGGEAVH